MSVMVCADRRRDPRNCIDAVLGAQVGQLGLQGGHNVVGIVDAGVDIGDDVDRQSAIGMTQRLETPTGGEIHHLVSGNCRRRAHQFKPLSVAMSGFGSGSSTRTSISFGPS